MSRKLTYSQVRELDAADVISHPMVRIQEPAFCTLAGAVALNSDLLRTLSGTPNEDKRSEWRLTCPMCQSFLGFWICAPGDVQLSSNQQRKNRNTLLLGKHYRKMHESAAAKGGAAANEKEVSKLSGKRKRQEVDSSQVTDDSESNASGGADLESKRFIMNDATFKKTLKKAEAGDVNAQIDVAYHFTYLSDPDELRMAHWFRKAAEGGSWDAQSLMSNWYNKGDCKFIIQDSSSAFAWGLKAAKQGCTQSQWNVGQMYETGRGVAKSMESAMEWYQRAATDRSEELESSKDGDVIQFAPDYMKKAQEKLKILKKATD